LQSSTSISFNFFFPSRRSITKILGDWWAFLPNEDKSPYKELAKNVSLKAKKIFSIVDDKLAQSEFRGCDCKSQIAFLHSCVNMPLQWDVQLLSLITPH
jgi:hypothetical protein